MCGIAGYFVAADGAPPQDAAGVLDRMVRAMAHRGPDGRGAWLAPGERAGLAHARLAILDLTDAGAQPMRSASGRCTITFNGEIYDFRALRAELEAEGVAFRTRSDTEVIVELYERHGAAAFSRLRGMYALAIWDEAAGAAVLARGPMGIKPLYVAEHGGRLAFASELRALARSGLIERHVEPGAVAALFRTGSVPEPHTLLRGVRMLAPGEVLTWRAGAAERARFWAVRERPRVAPAGAADPVARTRAALEDSVRAHLVSDVPVALLLSGGIDSTALLAVLHRLGLHRDLACYSLAVDDHRLDEGEQARAIARRFGVRHHVTAMDARAAADAVDAFLGSLDVPSVDGFNTWLVTRALRADGIKVALSGLGADEVFGGYPSFQQLPPLRRAVRALRAVPGAPTLAAGALGLAGRLTGDGRCVRLGEMVRSDGSLPALYGGYRALFGEADARRLAAHFCGVPEARVAPVESPPSGPAGDDDLDEISLLEQERYMRNQLLRDTDVTSMAHGVELRVPFVDRVLMDELRTVPPAIRLRRGKRLLLDAVPEVPADVANRPKRGFTMPFDRWLRADLAGHVERLRAPVPLRAWYQAWIVLAFGRWLEALA